MSSRSSPSIVLTSVPQPCRWLTANPCESTLPLPPVFRKPSPPASTALNLCGYPRSSASCARHPASPSSSTPTPAKAGMPKRVAGLEPATLPHTANSHERGSTPAHNLSAVAAGLVPATSVKSRRSHHSLTALCSSVAPAVLAIGPYGSPPALLRHHTECERTSPSQSNLHKSQTTLASRHPAAAPLHPD